VITDAGFRAPWFRAVEAMGWHWIGRVRHRTVVLIFYIIATLILLVVNPHLAMLMALWIIGSIAGILTGWLRKNRCPIPSLRTSIHQLPVW
jgi:hypothetical protein